MKKYIALTCCLILVVTVVIFKENFLTPNPECQGENVYKISVPLSYQDHNKTMDLSYQLYPSSTPNAPTLFYLPGGPGEPGIGFINDTPEGFRKYWLSKFNIVATELRGTHCNNPPKETPSDFYTPHYLVHDMAKVMEDVKRRQGLSSYVIYGHSYGTALATLLSHKIRQDQQLPEPDLVVLEGVLGRAFKSADEVYQAYEKGFMELLPPLKKAQPLIYKELMKKKPFGIDGGQWGQWISKQLMYGLDPHDEGIAHPLLDGLTEDHFEATKSAIREMPLEAPSDLYRNVACSQISSFQAGIDGKDLILKSGKLVRADNTICTGIKQFEELKYDSAKTELGQIPIVYLQGTKDQATPPWQAKYHYLNHDGPKLMVNVHGAGHVLSKQLFDCFPDMFEKLLDSSKNIEELAKKGVGQSVFATCRWHNAKLRKGVPRQFSAGISFGLLAPQN